MTTNRSIWLIGTPWLPVEALEDLEALEGLDHWRTLTEMPAGLIVRIVLWLLVLLVTFAWLMMMVKKMMM